MARGTSKSQLITSLTFAKLLLKFRRNFALTLFCNERSNDSASMDLVSGKRPGQAAVSQPPSVRSTIPLFDHANSFLDYSVAEPLQHNAHKRRGQKRESAGLCDRAHFASAR